MGGLSWCLHNSDLEWMSPQEGMAEWMCVVPVVSGARAGDGRDGDGEVTDWTGWSGGDGSGEAWCGEMHGQHSYL